MAAQGRRGGTRPRRSTSTKATGAQAPATPIATEPFAPPATIPAPVAQLSEDRSVPIAGRPRVPLVRSLGGAIAGAVLVVGLAFGAALGSGDGPGSRDGTATLDTAAAGHDTGSTARLGEWGGGKTTGGTEDHAAGGASGDAEATDKPDAGDAEATDKPTADPTDKPESEATAKPKSESTPKPEQKPDPTKAPTEPITIELAIVELHPKVAWGSCDGLDFDYYKVVRSTNSSVSWPTGDGDQLIAAIEPGGSRKAYDKNAPHGVKVWYRVFCVRKGEDGYKVVNASATKGIEVPEEPAPPPPPDPISLELGFSVTDGGKVVLDWSACDVDGFAFYKVVRSTSNDDPSYFPWTDGTEVVAVVSDVGATAWEGWAPDSGQTAWYRVQCLGYAGDQKVLLGESDVVTVTNP